MAVIVASTVGTSFQQRRYRIGSSTYPATHSSFALAEHLRRRQGIEQPVRLRVLTGGDEVDTDLLQVETERAGITDLDVVEEKDPGTLYRRLSRDLSGRHQWFNVDDGSGRIGVVIIALASSRCTEGGTETRLFTTDPGTGGSVVRLRDLTTILRAPAWKEAVRHLEERDEDSPLVDLLHEIHDESYRTPDAEYRSTSLQELASMLERSVVSDRSALPLESGRSPASSRDEGLQENVETDLRALAPECLPFLDRILERLNASALDREVESKVDIPLDESELQRQFGIVERLYRTEHPLPAFLILRELLVNGSILGGDDRLPGEEWLDPDIRDRYTAPFYHLTHWNRDDELRAQLDENQKRVARLWEAIKRRRNDLAHAGFTSEWIMTDRLGGRLGPLLDEVHSIVIEERSILEHLTPIASGGQTLFFSMGDDGPAGTYFRAVRSPLSDLERIVFMISASTSRSNIDRFMEGAGNRIGETDVWVFPAGKKGLDRWEKFWYDNRSSLLNSERVVLSPSGGSEPVRHACYRIFEELQHFGVPARMVGQRTDEIEQGGVSDDSRVLTLQKHDVPWTARSE